MKNLNQIRAQRAFSFVERNQNNKDVMNILTRLPEMFHANGLLATFAFLMKKQEERKTLIDDLLTHLKEAPLNLVAEGFDRNTIFNENAGWVNPDNFTTTQFFVITDEMIQYATWLKRAAEALATEEAGG